MVGRVSGYGEAKLIHPLNLRPKLTQFCAFYTQIGKFGAKYGCVMGVFGLTIPTNPSRKL